MELSPNNWKKIESTVDSLFDRLKERLLGYGVGDKQIRITATKPHETLIGLGAAAALDMGGRVSGQSVKGIVKIGELYIDSVKARAKAELAHRIAHAPEGSDVRPLIFDSWKKVTSDVDRVVDTTAQQTRALGTTEGVVQMNLSAGVKDPVVFFVVKDDDDLCKECRRLHLMEDGKTPRLWYLSECGHGYHKHGDDHPKTAGLHPHCRCGMSTLLPGWGFKGGRVAFISPGFDAISEQRTGR